MSKLKSRIKPTAIHFIGSIVVAIVMACLVLFLWYPAPYSFMAGGLSLLFILISVDVVLGPSLTFVVFDIKKPRDELVRDITIICFIQLCGLAYGLHTVYMARPVALVLELTQFRVVSAVDVKSDELKNVAEQFQSLSLTGPQLVGTRGFKDKGDESDALNKSLAGYDIGTRPSFWQDYDLSKTKALQLSKPVSLLYRKYPNSKTEIDAAVKRAGIDATQLRFIPIFSLRGDWVALIHPSTARPVAFLEKDGFF
jgi:hypothetical protein